MTKISLYINKFGMFILLPYHYGCKKNPRLNAAGDHQ